MTLAEGRPRAASTQAGYESAWSLFLDWCAATGRQSMPATPDSVAAFITACPAGPSTLDTRARAIHLVHVDAGAPSPISDEVVLAALRASGAGPADRAGGPGFDPDQISAALNAIPVRGWPASLAGRRDGCLLAMLAVAELGRTETLALVPDALTVDVETGEVTVVRSDGMAVTMLPTESPTDCPCCATTRWLRTASMCERRMRRGTRAVMEKQNYAQARRETEHDCVRPLKFIPSKPLFTAIDQHGYRSEEPLSIRAISTIVADRLARGDEPEPIIEEVEAEPTEIVPAVDPMDMWPEDRPAVVLPPRPQWTNDDHADAAAKRQQAVAAMADVDAILDALDARMDEAMARINETLDGVKDELSGISDLRRPIA